MIKSFPHQLLKLTSSRGSKKTSIFDIQSDFCKALAHPARLQILNLLRERPRLVSEIVDLTGFTQTLVSRQLAVLRSINVVDSHRHGSDIIYQIVDEGITEICDLVNKLLARQIQKSSSLFKLE